MKPFINLLDYFQRFRTLSMNRMVSPSVMERDSLTFWRVNVLFAILFTALVLCTLTIGAAIFLAIKEKVWGLVIFDVLGYVICISLLLSRRLSYEIRAAVTLLMFYIVGLAVIVSVGPLSGGPVWLFTFAVLVGVLLGSKAAMVAIAVNGITLTIIAWLLSTGQFGLTFPFFNTSQVMVSAGVNFIVLNVIAAMSVSVLVKGLVSSHQKEKVLLSNIEQERVHLMEAKKGLELEVEERKQVEEALRESEAQKKAILDASIDVIRLVDKDMKIIWANKRTTTELKAAPEQLIGRFCYEAVAGRDTPCPGCPTKKALKSGKTEHALMSQKELNGIKEETYWDDYVVPIKNELGDIINLIQISRNITDHKKAGEEKENLEAQLRQSQKMQAISTLAGGIAHDFNNILTAIMGYGQLAQMKLDPESEVYADLKEVLQSGNRAKLLIQQILAIGRDQEQERQPMQPKYIVREVLKFLKSTLPSTIEIQEKIDKDVGVIDADPTQMHQVLMNLCTNAGHAMDKDGGILKVSLRNVTVGPQEQESGVHLEPGPYLRLGVSDTGYGIAPEIREKIFDPYFTTKGPGVGTGIGLSVVHGIVAQHGGDITVESEPGKGSTFHVYLPLTQGEEEQPEVQEETPLPKGTERVLFIDDEAVLANMGNQMLESLGYDVTSMTSSLEALALFKEDPKQFDLVITDTTMPNMPGDILAHKIMELRPDTPVIICTGHSKRISKEKAKQMGIKGFLMKPPAMRDLADMVRKVLDEK